MPCSECAGRPRARPPRRQCARPGAGPQSKPTMLRAPFFCRVRAKRFPCGCGPGDRHDPMLSRAVKRKHFCGFSSSVISAVGPAARPEKLGPRRRPAARPAVGDTDNPVGVSGALSASRRRHRRRRRRQRFLVNPRLIRLSPYSGPASSTQVHARSERARKKHDDAAPARAPPRGSLA